jgi:hypothetical protein
MKAHFSASSRVFDQHRVLVWDLAERHAGGAAGTSVSELVACG